MEFHRHDSWRSCFDKKRMQTGHQTALTVLVAVLQVQLSYSSIRTRHKVTILLTSHISLVCIACADEQHQQLQVGTQPQPVCQHWLQCMCRWVQAPFASRGQSGGTNRLSQCWGNLWSSEWLSSWCGTGSRTFKIWWAASTLLWIQNSRLGLRSDFLTFSYQLCVISHPSGTTSVLGVQQSTVACFVSNNHASVSVQQPCACWLILWEHSAAFGNSYGNLS